MKNCILIKHCSKPLQCLCISTEQLQQWILLKLLSEHSRNNIVTLDMNNWYYKLYYILTKHEYTIKMHLPEIKWRGFASYFILHDFTGTIVGPLNVGRGQLARVEVSGCWTHGRWPRWPGVAAGAAASAGVGVGGGNNVLFNFSVTFKIPFMQAHT